MSDILERTSQQPITFYGKVIDQNGAPVVGADIRGNVEISRKWMDQSWEEHHTTTDAEGRFTLSGLHGQSLVVTPSKQGYSYTPKMNDAFAYSILSPEKERHKPDVASPVVFTVWKQKGPEPLVQGDKFFGIKPDATPFTINLLTGKKLQGRALPGDLVVTISRPAQVLPHQRFDWTFTVEGVDGGIIEAGNPLYPYEAPETGYVPSLTQNARMSDPGWSERIRKNFYVKSREGHVFAYLKAEMIPKYQDGAVFSVQYVANPSGSRNLEVDKSKITRVQ